MAPPVNEITCKTVIVGDSGVGKTSLMYRFCKGDYVTHNSTIVTNFESRCIQLFDKTVKIEIWDTAGQERFFAVTKLYFRNTMGVVFVYDVTRPETLFNMEKWFNAVKNETSSDVIKVLVGHKCDDENFKKISTTEGKAVADYFGMVFFEASSKENAGVYPIFNFLASKAIDLHWNEIYEHRMDGFILTNENNSNQSDSSCWLSSVYDWFKF